MNTAQFTPAGTLTAEDLGAVHLIGIGGVGMSGLARLLLTRGIRVSGSELRDWPSLAGLRALGGTIHMSHDVANLDGVDTVVYSTAIPADHVELAEARRRGLRVLHRSEALAATMTGRKTDRGRRHARQDHHHLDGDAGASSRPVLDPVLRHRRGDLRGRVERPPRQRRVLRRRGRRERPLVPALPAVRVDHHQHRRGPPQHLRRLRQPGGDLRRLRPADRPGGVRGRLRRQPGHPGAGGEAARRGTAGLHLRRGRRRRPAADRHRLLRPGRALPGHRRRHARWARCGCRSPGATSASTAPRRC